MGLATTKDENAMKAALLCVKGLCTTGLGAVILLIVMLVPLPLAKLLRAADEMQSAKANAQMVVIDMVARDKKGSPIIDLKESDVEIQEDGVKQKITGFRLVGPGTTAAAASGDPLQGIKLVTMVFQNQFTSPDGQRVARNAVNEFLKLYTGENVVVGMFTIDKRFCIVQQYTNKKEYLSEALDKAIAQDYEPLQKKSDAIQKGLAAIASGNFPAQPDHALGEPATLNWMFGLHKSQIKSGAAPRH